MALGQGHPYLHGGLRRRGQLEQIRQCFDEAADRVLVLESAEPQHRAGAHQAHRKAILAYGLDLGHLRYDGWRMPTAASRLTCLGAAALALAACSKAPSQAVADPGGDVGPVADPAPYPGAALLCSEHVTGAPERDGRPGAHITWRAYTTADPQERVTAHYLAALGSVNHAREGDEDIWRFPRNRPRRMASVHPATSSGPWSDCAPAPAGTRTVVLLSSIVSAD